MSGGNRNKPTIDKGRLTGLLLGSFLLLLLGVEEAAARTLWREGVVTREIWGEAVRYLEVDGVRFTLMPESAAASGLPPMAKT